MTVKLKQIENGSNLGATLQFIQDNLYNNVEYASNTLIFKVPVDIDQIVGQQEDDTTNEIAVITDSYATTSYVQQQINNLKNGVPIRGNTLNKLYNLIGTNLASIDGVDEYTITMLHFRNSFKNDGTDCETQTWLQYGGTSEINHCTFSNGQLHLLSNAIRGSNVLIGAKDWTIDFRVKDVNPTSTNKRDIFTLCNNAGTQLFNVYFASTTKYPTLSIGSNTVVCQTQFTGYVHIALIYDNYLHKIKFYVDGSYIGELNLTMTRQNHSAYIGGLDEYATGSWYKEFRISDDIKRWTVDFDPPIQDYTTIGGDPETPAPEGTPVLYIVYGDTTVTSENTTGQKIGTITVGDKTVTFYVDLSNYAPANNPTFTGVPTAPIASVSSGTSLGQIATVGFVQNYLTNISSMAPELLSTLSTIKEWLENNENSIGDIISTMATKLDKSAISVSATTVEGIEVGRVTIQGNTTIFKINLSNYATLNSPHFTGYPTSTTPVINDNSNKIATTSFVQREMASMLEKSTSTYEQLKDLLDSLLDDNGTTIESLLALLGSKLNTSGGTITGNLTINGNLEVLGSATLTVDSTTYAIKALKDINNNDLISYYAPLNSPEFTGVPTAPEPDATDNSHRIATTHYVTEAVNSALFGNNDGNNNDNSDWTISDIVNAINNSKTFYSDINSAIGERQPQSNALTSIAGLTTSANKMIYATGANTYSTTDLTSFVRENILNQTSIAGFRNRFGIVPSVYSLSDEEKAKTTNTKYRAVSATYAENADYAQNSNVANKLKYGTSIDGVISDGDDHVSHFGVAKGDSGNSIKTVMIKNNILMDDISYYVKISSSRFNGARYTVIFPEGHNATSLNLKFTSGNSVQKYGDFYQIIDNAIYYNSLIYTGIISTGYNSNQSSSTTVYGADVQSNDVVSKKFTPTLDIEPVQNTDFTYDSFNFGDYGIHTSIINCYKSGISIPFSVNSNGKKTIEVVFKFSGEISSTLHGSVNSMMIHPSDDNTEINYTGLRFSYLPSTKRIYYLLKHENVGSVIDEVNSSYNWHHLAITMEKTSKGYEIQGFLDGISKTVNVNNDMYKTNNFILELWPNTKFSGVYFSYAFLRMSDDILYTEPFSPIELFQLPLTSSIHVPVYSFICKYNNNDITYLPENFIGDFVYYNRTLYLLTTIPDKPASSPTIYLAADSANYIKNIEADTNTGNIITTRGNDTKTTIKPAVFGSTTRPGAVNNKIWFDTNNSRIQYYSSDTNQWRTFQ